jgi:hypothetical protein
MSVVSTQMSILYVRLPVVECTVAVRTGELGADCAGEDGAAEVDGGAEVTGSVCGALLLDAARPPPGSARPVPSVVDEQADAAVSSNATAADVAARRRIMAQIMSGTRRIVEAMPTNSAAARGCRASLCA